MEPSERVLMWIGVVAAVIVVTVSAGVRAWRGPGAWVTGATIVLVVAWTAWVLWSRYRGRDGDDRGSDG